MLTAIPIELLDLIDRPGLTDICISSNLTELDAGQGLSSTQAFLIAEPELGELARFLIELGGRRLDQSSPFADVNLPGGLRVHAVLASDCSPKTQISIRLQNQQQMTLGSFLEQVDCSDHHAHLLEQIFLSGESFLIAGPTGTGKTTLLRCLISSSTDRIVAIEDVMEITGESVLNLQSRPKNIEGAGEITLSDLVSQSLRMRPDRIIIGEVRGAELIPMLQALNTGHRGATTIHANSLFQIPERLLAIAATQQLSEELLGRLVVAAFDWVIALGIKDNQRAVTGIGQFELIENRLEVFQVTSARRLALA